jgi:hypothetical protein
MTYYEINETLNFDSNQKNSISVLYVVCCSEAKDNNICED